MPKPWQMTIVQDRSSGLCHLRTTEFAVYQVSFNNIKQMVQQEHWDSDAVAGR